MGFYNEMQSISEPFRKIPGVGERPSGGISSFRSKVGSAARLCLEEKEILVFCLLQWAAIGLVYLLWVQALDWIPETAWRSVGHRKGDARFLNMLVLLWSFLCVGLAAFPVGILSGCMGAAHFLRRQGRPSTIAGCLRLVAPQSWSLWIFHWVDGWVTVNQILERLPRKNDRRTPIQKAASEAAYHAWKVGIAGVLPCIVTGHKLVMAGWNSMRFVKENFPEVARLRAGYSVLCWAVGTAAYLGTVLLFNAVDIVPPGKEIYGAMYPFYLWAGIPIVIAVGVVLLFLRPIYVLGMCDLYSDYLEKNKLEAELPEDLPPAVSALVAFLCIGLLLLVVYGFHDDMGITDLLRVR